MLGDLFRGWRFGVARWFKAPLLNRPSNSVRPERGEERAASDGAKFSQNRAPEIVWAGLSILLSNFGCAWFGEGSTRSPMHTLPDIAATLQAARDQSPVNTQWPEQKWWRQFKDAELTRLIETALADNPDLKAAEARLGQAQAMVDAQAAELYPTVNASLSFTAQRFSANGVQAKLAGEHFRQLLINPLVLRYHLDFWGRDEAALQGAVGHSLAVAAETADARLLLTVAVAGAYFDLQATMTKLALTENIVATRTVLAKLEQARFDHGLSHEAPTLQASIGLSATKQQEAGLQAEAALQRHLLASLAGQGPDWGLSIAPQTISTLEVLLLPADLPLRLLSHRPDLTAARMHVEAAAEEIKVAETAFYPDINLLAFTGLHSVSLTDIALQGASLAYAIGPSVEFPIFEGGRLRANLSYRQAAYDAAVERYNASLLHAVREVADALSRWRESELRLTAQRQILANAEADNRVSEAAARAGLGDQSKPLLASVELNRERLLLTSLHAERHKAVVRIIKALGGGYDAGALPKPNA